MVQTRESNAILRQKNYVTKIKKILKWMNTYTAAIAIVSIGMFFFYHEFERPKLKTSIDILQLEGKVTNYSFTIKSGFKSTLKQYYIWLENYPCAFQIKADFLPYFYQTKFENDVNIGDKIKLSIPKEFENQIWNKNNNVFIFSASKNSTTFLNLEQTIPKENDNFDIYAGLFFITVGIGYYILKKKKILK
jgi:hypothetical protein